MVLRGNAYAFNCETTEKNHEFCQALASMQEHHPCQQTKTSQSPKSPRSINQHQICSVIHVLLKTGSCSDLAEELQVYCEAVMSGMQSQAPSSPCTSSLLDEYCEFGAYLNLHRFTLLPTHGAQSCNQRASSPVLETFQSDTLRKTKEALKFHENNPKSQETNIEVDRLVNFLLMESGLNKEGLSDSDKKTLEQFIAKEVIPRMNKLREEAKAGPHELKVLKFRKGRVDSLGKLLPTEVAMLPNGKMMLGLEENVLGNGAVKDIYLSIDVNEVLSSTPLSRSALKATSTEKYDETDPDSNLQLKKREKECEIQKKLATTQVVHLEECQKVSLGDGKVKYYVTQKLYDRKDLKVFPLKHLSQREKRKAELDLLDQLQEAHKANIVHRDLKPANVFLATDPSGDITTHIGDFGEADYRNDIDFESPKGSFTFMAPELAEHFGKGPDKDAKNPAKNPKDENHKFDVLRKADTWAMGLVFYYLETGKNRDGCHPNSNKGVVHLLHQTLGPIKTYDQLCAACSVCFTDKDSRATPNPRMEIVRKMLNPNAEERITPEQAHKEFNRLQESRKLK